MIKKTSLNMFDNTKYNRLAIKNNENYKKAKPYPHIQLKNSLQLVQKTLKSLLMEWRML